MKRIGKIEIRGIIYDSMYFTDVFKIFMVLKPIRIEYETWRNMWVITAESPNFEELKEAEVVPLYSVELSDGIKFTKI